LSTYIVVNLPSSVQLRPIYILGQFAKLVWAEFTMWMMAQVAASSSSLDDWWTNINQRSEPKRQEGGHGGGL
jgi:hypothetical protein